MPQDKLDLIDILGLRDDPTLPPEERRRRARERGRILGSESAMAQAQIQADALLAQGGNALVDAALNSPFELATSFGTQVAERYAPSGQEIYERTRRDPLSVRELSPAEEQQLDEYQAQKHATDVARSEAFWDYLMHVPRSSEEIGQILKWMADPNARPEDMPAGGFLPELALGISPIGIAQDIRDIYRDISQGEVGGWTAAAAIPAGGDIARGIRRARAASKATDVARLVHYGPQAGELDVIDPKYMGRGQPGAERARQEAMGERFQPRSYFYREGDPVEPRFQNQPSATVELPESAIYDLTKDPEGLLPQARKQAAADGLFGDEAVQTYAENLATERGYRATYDGRKVQVFEPTPVVREATPPTTPPTREEFLGKPKIVREGRVFAAGSNFGPVWYRSAERATPEPFMGGKYTIRRGLNEGSPFYNVYDGDKLIASYDGETLAVEKAYRQQGIGEELVVDLRGRHPEIGPAGIRTETSQRIMERAYERLYGRGEETAAAGGQGRFRIFKEEWPALTERGSPSTAFSGEIQTKSGEYVPFNGTYNSKTGEIYIDEINAGGKRVDVGLSELRALQRELQTMFPEAKTFGGFRTGSTGGRPGREVSVGLAKPVQLEAAIRLPNGEIYSAGGPLHAPSIDQAVTLENVSYATAARATRGFLHPETGEFMTAAETRAFREGTYEPERVVGAVMRVGGEDFVGLSHSDAIEAARHAGKSEAEINAALRTNREGWGFRTNRGRNVGRKEAADIETAERERRAATVAPVKRGLNESIIEAHATGGSTFDPRTGKNMVGTEKWSVSPLKETETVYERPLVPEDVAEFRERNAKLLEDPDLFVGTWEDEGKHYIDIVTLVDDEEDAIRIGIGADQKSIAHLGRVARKEWDTAFQEVPQVSEADRALARSEIWERFPVLSEMRRERFISHLDPAQRKRFDKLGEERQKQALRIYSLMPTPREGASLAMVGAAQRGWYEASGKTLYDIFGDDAPRFTAMLASFSPQMKVEDNLVAALEMWKRWINAGRPVDRAEIANLIPTGIALEKPPIYSAVEPNTYRALTATNEELLDLNILEEGGFLSGMKVDPFYANLMGATQRVTIDTHMTRLGPTEPKAVGVTKNIGMSAATRAVIDEMEKLTGTRLDPREIQEMQWSGLKSMMERLPNEGLGRAANKMSIEEILFGPNAETFAGPIEELRFASERTPSFASLFEKPEISKYLEAIQGAQMPTPRRPIGLQIDPSKIRLEDLRRIAQRMDMARWKQYLFQLAPFGLIGGGLLAQQLMGAGPEERPSLFQN